MESSNACLAWACACNYFSDYPEDVDKVARFSEQAITFELNSFRLVLLVGTLTSSSVYQQDFILSASLRRVMKNVSSLLIS